MSSTVRRFACSALVVAAIAAATLGCAPYAPGASPSGTATVAPTTPAASGTPSATESPAEPFTFPTSCDELYSPDFRATLDADIAPLNDPGTTMLSTENPVAIETIEGAAETLRCSWGPPSERGISTNVTVVTPEQRDELSSAFEGAGFSTEDYQGGTLHRIEHETLTQDDVVVTISETHYLHGDGWVATRWINVDPDGYMEDIIASLWG
ncbi:MAG: hypothetical protein ABW024_01755 [Microbacterium sp.]